MKINITDIEIGLRKRKLDEGKVKSIADSFGSVGQLNPITIAHGGDFGKYYLIAGLHRLEAAKLLGWQAIEATVFSGDTIEAELAEIDENLMRNDLTVLEQGEHLQRRNEILEAMGQRAPSYRPEKGSTVLPLKTTADIAKEVGLSETSAQRRMQVARNIVPEVKDAIRNTEIADSTTQLLELARLTPEKQVEVARSIVNGAASVIDAKREIKKAEVIANLEDVKVKEAKAVEGVYDVIVIDPPWPMKKIERDIAPDQVEFDYPTMTIDEIKALEVPCADNCHVWLWTTHKYLPDALEILQAWDMKYVCTFVWHKPGGFQPFGLPQYNAEFALYARKGTPEFTDFKDFKLCFDAPRTGHSEKPDYFYELVRRVTAGRRLDMFSRRAIPGFDSWGKEAI